MKVNINTERLNEMAKFSSLSWMKYPERHTGKQGVERVGVGAARREAEAPVLVLRAVRLNGLVDPFGELLDDWHVQERREIRRPLAVP